MSQIKLPKANPIIYELSRFVLGIFFNYYFHYQAVGVENIPASGPLLVVANHVSSIDGLFIMYAFKNKRLTWVVKREAMDDPITGIYLKLGGGISVDREILDIKSAKVLIEYLRQKGIVGIFPEGTRTLDGQVHAFMPGFIKLALITRSRILPATTLGVYEALPKGQRIPKETKVVVKFGPIIDLEEFYGKRLSDAETRTLSEMVRSKVVALRED